LSHQLAGAYTRRSPSRVREQTQALVQAHDGHRSSRANGARRPTNRVNRRKRKRPDGLMPLVRYVCKGIYPSVARRMHIRPVDRGVTVGKRSGVGRSLGKAAIKRRREAGFAKPVRGWQARAGNSPASSHAATGADLVLGGRVCVSHSSTGPGRGSVPPKALLGETTGR
jgi:hypothetical protein